MGLYDKKKNIAWIFRSKERNEHSIENVFDSLENHFDKQYEIKKYYLPSPYYNSIRNIKRNIDYVNEIQADIIHITGECYCIVPFLKHKHVLITMHDYNNLENNRGVKRLASYLLFDYFPLKKCSMVTCISNEVLDQTNERFYFCKNKSILIPDPVNDLFKSKKKKFNKECPNLLVVGTRENKNLGRIIEAVAGLSCRLIIIGKLERKYELSLKEKNIIYINKYNISNEEMYDQYCDCDIVCFPSTFEGFGMPIIEGQATGRVILTSNIEPMKDVSGGAAILVDPYVVDSIKEGLLRIINDDDNRDELIHRGFINAEKYNASIIAQNYQKIYERLKEHE